MPTDPAPSWEECHRLGMTVKAAAEARGVDIATAYHAAARRGLVFAGQNKRSKPTVPARGAGQHGEAYGEADWQSCYALWAALLLDQINCATRPRKGPAGSGSTLHRKGDKEDLEIYRARLWMGGPDFRMVCSLLGIDHERVLRYYHARLDAIAETEGRR